MSMFAAALPRSAGSAGSVNDKQANSKRIGRWNHLGHQEPPRFHSFNPGTSLGGAGFSFNQPTSSFCPPLILGHVISLPQVTPASSIRCLAGSPTYPQHLASSDR